MIAFIYSYVTNMPETGRIRECDDCGEILDEPMDQSGTDQMPCPNCESLQPHVRLSFSETLPLHEKHELKIRGPEGGKPRYESVQGDDLHRKSGRWMQLKRIIDRVNNRYQEIITDPETGEVVHKNEEPLSEHRGHGSAKMYKINTTDDDA
ncbi:MAG: zinc ribbon domain-containing protein [Candidatus Marinimicrobia bacterium]|nr:zinc ribbon domain-containing protein [Candidatus Neomarinimicrobiota bacterium]